MGVSGQRHAPAALLPPGKGPPVPIGQEAGWASEPVWIQRIEEHFILRRSGFESRSGGEHPECCRGFPQILQANDA
jgi:hypothetical protein